MQTGAAGFVVVCARGVGAACSAAFRPGNVGPETGWGSAMDAAGWPRSGAGHVAGRVSSPGSPRAQTERPIRVRPDDPPWFHRATVNGHPATGPARLLPIETTSEAVGCEARSVARSFSWPPAWHEGWDKYGPRVRKKSTGVQAAPCKGLSRAGRGRIGCGTFRPGKVWVPPPCPVRCPGADRPCCRV